MHLRYRKPSMPYTQALMPSPSEVKLSDTISLISRCDQEHILTFAYRLGRALSSASEKKTVHLTYEQAGVSVEAGNRLVEVIKPHVRSTRRPGADAEIGGFGGAFDLKAIGYKDPILVSGTDGVGTKLRVAVDVGIHDLVGGFP